MGTIRDRSQRWIKLAIIAGTLVGALAGPAATRAWAQSFPNQCYNNGGSNLCPFCGGGCLGSNYLCCNQGGTQ